jgi:uncharacterized integral membrane protein (TIGR00697 family)
MARFKYLDVLTTTFVVLLLVSNLVAQKLCRIGPVTLSAAMLLFPLTYIFGDIFTEIYGYAASRRAIWMGFFASGLLWATAAAALALPPDARWQNQQAFVTVFNFLPRMWIASLVSFFAGEFANSYVMARLKLETNGRWLWTRTVGSTIVGQAIDTVIFMYLTFFGIYSNHLIGEIILVNYVAKVAYEVLATPLTYAVIAWLKRAEGTEAFDAHTNFNPFKFSPPTTPAG